MAYENDPRHETRKYVPLLETNEECWPPSNNHSAYIIVDITSEESPEIIARGRHHTDIAHEWLRNMEEKTFYNRATASKTELHQNIDQDKIKTLENKLRKSIFETLDDEKFEEFKNINKDYKRVVIEYKNTY